MYLTPNNARASTMALDGLPFTVENKSLILVKKIVLTKLKQISTQIQEQNTQTQKAYKPLTKY